MAKKRRRAAPDLSESDVMFTEHDSVLTRHPTLIDQIKQTADGLKQDKTSRGDLKILRRALRELRSAFTGLFQHEHAKLSSRKPTTSPRVQQDAGGVSRQAGAGTHPQPLIFSCSGVIGHCGILLKQGDHIGQQFARNRGEESYLLFLECADNLARKWSVHRFKFNIMEKRFLAKRRMGWFSNLSQLCCIMKVVRSVKSDDESNDD